MNLETLRHDSAAIPLAELRALDRAIADARRHIALTIPDPEEFAFTMSSAQVALLRTAAPHKNGYVVDPHAARHLRALGLVECGSRGRFLTAFGRSVHAILLRDA